MLTDRAKETAESVATWMRFAAYLVTMYALAQRMSTLDAFVVTFGAIEVLRAVRGRATEARTT